MKALRPWIVLGVAGMVLVCGAAFNLRRSSLLPWTHALPVRVVAHEWWWEFDYPTLGIETSDALHLPSHETVRLELQSGDVIHSFWIDGMRKPIDLPPGKTQHLDLDVKSPGELHGNCDAGCGCGTVCMRFRVVASTPKDFNSWVARQKSAPSRMTAHNTTPPACALDKSVDHRESPQPSRPDTPPFRGSD
jgi:heme/copper-type cytochrome/quinol oxidase subunit 2